MKMPIIALGRQFGSGGRTIGKQTAEKLGIPCCSADGIRFLFRELKSS